MAKKKEGFRKSNFRVFLIILLLTTGISLMVKLNKTFNYEVKVPLSFVNLPEDKILKSFSTDNVKVSGIATGYEYLKYKLSKQEYVIDLAKLNPISQDTFFYNFKKENRSLGGSLSESEILNITPDTIYFDLDENFEKQVAINPRVNLEFSPGYGSLEGLLISPDSVSVRGPQGDLEKLKEVFTENLDFKGIKENLQDSIELKLAKPNDQIEIVPSKVSIRVVVDKFTEGSISIPLQLINVPRDFTAKVFPKKVNLIFNVNLKDYERVKISEFKVVCDFSKIDSTTTSISPEIIEYPNFVRDVRLRQKTVQYVLVR